MRAWASFGWYTIEFPRYVYGLIVLAMAGTIGLGIVAIRREWPWVRTRLWELLALALTARSPSSRASRARSRPRAPRSILAEMGRYLFPAISALAILAIGATVGVGRRRAVSLATGVVVAEFVLRVCVAAPGAARLLHLTFGEQGLHGVDHGREGKALRRLRAVRHQPRTQCRVG